MQSQELEIPVVLFVFRRINTVQLIFEQLMKIRPKTLYVFSDGPRKGLEEEMKKVQEVRDYIKEAVQWDCDVHMEFASENKGCAENICDGIDQVFQKETAAIILEDDAVPMEEFFLYCQELLIKYNDEEKIQYIAGFNAVGDTDTINESYAFSMTAPMSGAIATWANRWNECDFDMKNWPMNKKKRKFRKYFYFKELYEENSKAFSDAYKKINAGWDYQLHHDQLDKQRFAIVPKGNLVKSYGYTEGAFHPQNQTEISNLVKVMDYTDRPFEIPMKNPSEIRLNTEYDRLRQKLFLEVRGNYLRRHIYYCKRGMKDIAYKFMPKPIWNYLKKIVGGK